MLYDLLSNWTWNETLALGAVMAVGTAAIAYFFLHNGDQPRPSNEDSEVMENLFLDVYCLTNDMAFRFENDDALGTVLSIFDMLGSIKVEMRAGAITNLPTSFNSYYENIMSLLESDSPVIQKNKQLINELDLFCNELQNYTRARERVSYCGIL